MPNARVGAMPNTPQAPVEVINDEGTKKKPKQRRKQKGITMEDLKQQTKVRLAKEQRRREAVSANKHMHQKRGHRPLEVSVSSDNSVGSSSLQSTQPTPIYSQNSADEFPHGKFNFRKHPAAAAASHAGASLGKQQNQHNQLEMQLSPNMKCKQQEQLYTSSNHSVAHSYTSRGSKTVISNSSSSKLPHGLTVQELKEMTRARLAAEASESKDCDTGPQVNPSHGTHQTHAYKSIQSPMSTDQFNRQRIFSAESFGSHERQRIGSVDSFGSAQHSYANSTYLRNRLGTSASMELEQPSTDSYSYDAQDNESYKAPHCSDSLFGLDGQRIKTSTSQYATNSSSVYRNPYSSEQISSPQSYSHRGVTQATMNTTYNRVSNDCWKSDISVGALSPSTVPTVAQSTSSFGASSDNEPYSYFSMPKFERAISAGAVVSNSVAESVLGPYDESGRNKKSDDIFYGYKPSINLTSSSNKPSSNDQACSSSFNFPWSLPPSSSSDKNDDENNNNGVLNIAELQSDWNKYLNIDLKGDKDDFPLSTFTSKASTSRFVRADSNNNNNNPGNHFYASPFQPVPEEHAFHNSNHSLSLDENIHESFLDDDDQNLTGMFRRKKRS